MALNTNLPNWIENSQTDWLRSAAASGASAISHGLEMGVRQSQFQQQQALAMRRMMLAEQEQTVLNQARLQAMNLKAIEAERDIAGMPVLESYQRSLQTWDGRQGDPPLPPASLPPRLMDQALNYRNQVLTTDAMLERKRVIAELTAQQQQIMSGNIRSAMQLRELTGEDAIEWHPQLGPRVNMEKLDAGWSKYRAASGAGAVPPGMTPTAMNVPHPGGRGYTRYEAPKQPTITMTLDKYKLTEFPKRKRDYANAINAKQRKMTDAEILSEIESEYQTLTRQPAQTAPAPPATPQSTSTPQQSYRVGQKAIYEGKLIEWNGMDWVEVQ